MIIKAQIICQVFFLIQESNVYYFYNHQQIKSISENKKSSEVKKNPGAYDINYSGSNNDFVYQ